MHQISEQDILRAVGSFYEAAQKASHDAWVDVWRQLAAMFRCGLGGFSFYNTRADEFTAHITDAAPSFIRTYKTKVERASKLRKKAAKLKAGERLNRRDVYTDEEFVELDLYEAFYGPAGIFHLEYQVFLVRPGMHGAVSFTRPPGERNFDEHELAAMAVLLPHLERAFQLYASLLDTELESKIMSAACDRLAANIIVANSDLEVVFANRSGRTILAAKDGLERDKHGRLVPFRSEDAKALAAAIDTSLKLEGDGPGQTLFIARPSGRRPLGLRVAPFENDRFGGFTQKPLAILFVCDPDHPAAAVDEVLMEMYGLTPAEARIATLIAEVNDLRTVCVMLGIKESTGRTHLKRIFSKTDTNKQSALIKLVLGGPAGIH